MRNAEKRELAKRLDNLANWIERKFPSLEEPESPPALRRYADALRAEADD